MRIFFAVYSTWMAVLFICITVAIRCGWFHPTESNLAAIPYHIASLVAIFWARWEWRQK